MCDVMRRKLKKLLSILTSRLVIIGLLILIQLAWFLILFLRLTQYATWINAGFVALSLLIELYIINKSGNPSYKILWLLFIGTFPVLGGLMYLLFGLLFVSFFVRSSIFSLLILLVLIYDYYRILSKDISARYQENQHYIQAREKVRTKWNKLTGSHGDSTHRIYKCPTCGQKVRVPKGKGKISIHCPNCNCNFIKRT